MQIFNISLLELTFIVLLAFIVLGPQKGVEAAGSIGRWIRKVVKSPFWRELMSTSRDIKDIPRKIMDDAEIQKTLEDIDRSTNFGKVKTIASEKNNKEEINADKGEENKIWPD